MALNPFIRRDNPYMLVVGMTGVKMGDRFLQVGCEHGGRLAAVASRVGLSGRAVAVVPDEAAAARARKGAERAGVLVDVDVGPPTRLAVEDQAMDVVVVDDTGGLLGRLEPADCTAAVAELGRVLRPGGRVVLVGAVPPSGMTALFHRAPGGPRFVGSAAAGEALAAGGFRAVRTLAERDGLVFVEGIKPRDTAPGEAGKAGGA